MSSQPVPFVTPEQYLEFDRNSDTRHEYVFGEIVPVMGATPWHGLIVVNTSAAVHNRISGGLCRAFASSVRVSVNKKALYSYPDLTVVCGPFEYLDSKKDTITNPKLIVEVLSPTTRDYDMGDKARMYFGVPSLDELLLTEQDQIGIEHWRRMPNGRWSFEVVHDGQAVILLESVNCEVPVAEIYQGVEFPELS